VLTPHEPNGLPSVKPGSATADKTTADKTTADKTRADRTMAALDAQMLMLSAKVPNDQFLLYAFDGTPHDLASAVRELLCNAAACSELRLRVVDEHRWRYPRWERGEITPDQFRIHDLTDDHWQSCLDRVSHLSAEQLDPSGVSWRVHVFPAVRDIPGGWAVGSVVVVQMTHALGDGTRSAELAGALLGRRQPITSVAPPNPGPLLWRAVLAARAHRRLVGDVDAGLLAPPVPPRPALSFNTGPRVAAAARTLVVDRDRLPGPTVTVGALVAISEALAGYLGDRGEDVIRLGAEVPMVIGGAGERQAHNNFRNVGIDLCPELRRAERAERIAGQLDAHHRRGAHPATTASTAAFAAVPAWLLRWGMGRFDPTVRSATITGHTVVSSVNRGPADLFFGGHPAVLTAGYPALSPMMSLTHGVHGIGQRVALSVHADPNVVDIDDYTERLSDALGCQP
jgi:hypothetical protein